MKALVIEGTQPLVSPINVVCSKKRIEQRQKQTTDSL